MPALEGPFLKEISVRFAGENHLRTQKTQNKALRRGSSTTPSQRPLFSAAEKILIVNCGSSPFSYFKGNEKGQTNWTNGAEFAVFSQILLIFAFPGKYNISEAQIFAETRRKPRIFAENHRKPQKPVWPI